MSSTGRVEAYCLWVRLYDDLTFMYQIHSFEASEAEEAPGLNGEESCVGHNILLPGTV
jgi:hypothetical protein